MNETIKFSDDISYDLSEILFKYNTDKIFVLVDENTFIHCHPLIKTAFAKEPYVIQIPAGEKSKDIETVTFLWKFLTTHNADRKSVLINLGGGMITDLGGFVASTYKRGIDFINIPTTVLAMVDAAIGGKNGINLENYKNHIGTFNQPAALISSTEFLKTLPQKQILSGFAEVIKHSLLSNEKTWNNIKNINPEKINFEQLNLILKESSKIKQNIVNDDPKETGIREALNFGHTVGHAIETFFNNKNIEILHGEAIAIGLIAELFISNKKFIFPFEKLFEITEYLATYFPSYKIDYNDYDELYNIMKHDKKNKNNKIIFTLLKNIGEVEINQTCSKEIFFEALNFYYQIKK
ncbi:MAG: 3-dehydroquinate synthase [Bacteroidales bacterium]|nr:3-dehydroquinate synthase [Bacteroidales bacterium]